jgi:RNA polymerase sigma factor (TIGR02999 family)
MLDAMPIPEQSPAGTVTVLLREARGGREGAKDELFALVYGDLRALARARLAEQRRGEPLDATGLVHAACERLLARNRLDANDRGHFFFLLGRAMHDVLVEEARAEAAQKRGGGQRKISLSELAAPSGSAATGILDLQEALAEFRRIDPEAARAVELRFFAGRTIEETAEAMNCTFSVARGHWEYAKGWLFERLSRDRGSQPAVEM